MRIVELILDDDKATGVEAISIVENPAIEENFVALNKEIEIKLAEVDSDKRILMGAALIPNKNIYRRSGDDEYYIFFSKDTVKKASELYLMNGFQNNATLEHNTKLKDLSVVESWIVESEVDKSRNYGLEMPIGTWMVSMKVNNEDIWQEFVKTKKVKGFSIEGYFSDKVEMNFQKAKDEELLELIKELILADEKKNSNSYKLESYTDYPDSVSNNAKRGIALNEKNGNKCATQVGKVRAQQLANKEPISLETIKRMYSYLSRAKEYYNENDTTACGTISYLLWGGDSALNWSESKLKQIENE